MTEYTEAQAQADVDRLIAQLEADPALRQAMLEDPRRVLAGAGMSEETIGEVDEALAGIEVEGFTFEVGAPGLAVGMNRAPGHGGALSGGTSVIVGPSISTYLPTGSIGGHAGAN